MVVGGEDIKGGDLQALSEDFIPMLQKLEPAMIPHDMIQNQKQTNPYKSNTPTIGSRMSLGELSNSLKPFDIGRLQKRGSFLHRNKGKIGTIIFAKNLNGDLNSDVSEPEKKDLESLWESHEKKFTQIENTIDKMYNLLDNPFTISSPSNSDSSCPSPLKLSISKRTSIFDPNGSPLLRRPLQKHSRFKPK